MNRLTEKEPYWLGEEFWTSAKEPDEEEIDKVYKKLKEYEDLEEQGLLIRLPCKIGDKIYYIYMDCPSDFNEELCTDHDGSCENCHHRVPIILSTTFKSTDILNIDYIFTNYKDAEARLKEIEEVRKQLAKCSDKELERELKRRKQIRKI